MVSEARSQY